MRRKRGRPAGVRERPPRSFHARAWRFGTSARRSYPDDETCFHLFEASEPAAVEEVSRQAALGASASSLRSRRLHRRVGAQDEHPAGAFDAP